MDFEDEAQLEAEVALTTSRNTKKRDPEANEGQLTVDVYQTDDEIIIKSTIAGVTDRDIDISVTNDMVTIKGTRRAEEKIKSSDYFHQELYWGSFSRSIILPEEVDSDNAKAAMKNGLLTLRLPKLARARTKKVRISS